MGNYMNQKEKTKFRQSSRWRKLRNNLKKNRKLDALTLQPLRKGWNLHHCDLRPENYTNIEDEMRFECLNKMSHETIHNIYRYWVKDKKILDRLNKILIKMEKYSNN